MYHQKNLQRFSQLTKTFYFDFDWPKNIDENLKQKIKFIINNKSLAENKIKKKRFNIYCPNISMETILMNWETVK